MGESAGASEGRPAGFAESVAESAELADALETSKTAQKIRKWRERIVIGIVAMLAGVLAVSAVRGTETKTTIDTNAELRQRQGRCIADHQTEYEVALGRVVIYPAGSAERNAGIVRLVEALNELESAPDVCYSPDPPGPSTTTTR